MNRTVSVPGRVHDQAQHSTSLSTPLQATLTGLAKPRRITARFFWQTMRYLACGASAQKGYSPCAMTLTGCRHHGRSDDFAREPRPPYLFQWITMQLKLILNISRLLIHVKLFLSFGRYIF